MENSVKKGIARGDYSVKQHLANVPKTMCRKNSLYKNDLQSFFWWAKNYPEACCIACLNYVKQRGLV
jgi:hypothetical protein